MLKTALLEEKPSLFLFGGGVWGRMGVRKPHQYNKNSFMASNLQTHY